MGDSFVLSGIGGGPRRRFLPQLAVSEDLLDDLGLAPLDEGDVFKTHIMYL
jgi:hypothetical protein